MFAGRTSSNEISFASGPLLALKRLAWMSRWPSEKAPTQRAQFRHLGDPKLIAEISGDLVTLWWVRRILLDGLPVSKACSPNADNVPT